MIGLEKSEQLVMCYLDLPHDAVTAMQLQRIVVWF